MPRCAIIPHFIKLQNCKFNGLKFCAVRNIATDIHYSNSGISNMLFMDSKAMTDVSAVFQIYFSSQPWHLIT